MLTYSHSIQPLKWLVFIFLILISFPGEGGKPQKDGVWPGNNFPGGPHFNLNILGKWSHFKCPPAEFDENNIQVYGKVIFVPREQGNDLITILMESGKKGPKGAGNTTELEVTDWCTESFADNGGGGNGDAAVLRLPKNDEGYAVYARILGKPGDNTITRSVSISPELVYVEDESGNDLILLGLVNSDGSFASESEFLNRTDTGKKGRGVQKATDLTNLFLWSGEVCYVQSDWDIFCQDEFGVDQCTVLELCCVDSDLDGVYEHCDKLSVVGELIGADLVCPAQNLSGDDYIAVEAHCAIYENEWVFNIGDFVGYLWDLDSQGAYHIQVRFYPLPLNTK